MVVKIIMSTLFMVLNFRSKEGGVSPPPQYTIAKIFAQEKLKEYTSFYDPQILDRLQQ